MDIFIKHGNEDVPQKVEIRHINQSYKEGGVWAKIYVGGKELLSIHPWPDNNKGMDIVIKDRSYLSNMDSTYCFDNFEESDLGLHHILLRPGKDMEVV